MFKRKYIKEDIEELQRQIQCLRSDINRSNVIIAESKGFRQEDREMLNKLFSIIETKAHIENTQKTEQDETLIKEQISRIEHTFEQISTKLNKYSIEERDIIPSKDGTAEAIRDYSKRLELYEKDFYLKLQTPFLMEMIHIADRLESLSKKEGMRSDDANDIQHECEIIKDFLFNNKVKPFQSEIGDKFDENKQECVDTVFTGDASKNDTIAESVQTGYYWTLPLVNFRSTDNITNARVIMREEKVRVFVYKN